MHQIAGNGVEYLKIFPERCYLTIEPMGCTYVCCDSSAAYAKVPRLQDPRMRPKWSCSGGRGGEVHIDEVAMPGGSAMANGGMGAGHIQ